MKIIIDDKNTIYARAGRAPRHRRLSSLALPSPPMTFAMPIPLLGTRTPSGEALLKGSRVKFIATATIGFDHIDTAWLAENGIGWTNCPGCNAGSVAQYVESALLLLARAGRIRLDAATTLAVVGVGHVGTQVALMAKRLGLNLLLCDPLRLQGCGGVEEGAPLLAALPMPPVAPRSTMFAGRPTSSPSIRHSRARGFTPPFTSLRPISSAACSAALS